MTTAVNEGTRLFGDLPLPNVLSDNLVANGFVSPTAIQAAAAMPIFRGGHALLHSATGSGKTLAYLLPLLSRMHLTKPSQTLIIVPSRELALQTAAVIERFWPHHGTRRACLLIGSESADEQIELIKRAACPVLVATPKVLFRIVRHLAVSNALETGRDKSN